ncbi:MAG: asparagine synthase-related protein [Acidobacteriota bacterium]|nr:asparagine synthase-related protein [Acidobacteriota bacterium]
MRSFAGVLQIDGSSPDPNLLLHLGGILRLDTSSEPVLTIDDRCGIVVVTHDRKAGTGATPSTCFGHVPASLAQIHTEFSFAVWDAPRRELFCARDRFGVRPFYYALTARAFVFSDSLDAVIAHPEVRIDELNERSVADYLSSGVSEDAEATIYAHVRRLPPAHVLRCDEGGRVTRERYWTLPARETRPRRDAVEHLEAALKSAIADRVTDPAAVVFMSGGLDSTLLAALTREVRPETRLLAGTSVYRRRIADVEEPFAAEAAQSIGIPMRTFPLDDYPPLQALDADIWTAEPGPLLTAPMTRDIYRAAAEHAPIALHGHPADAVLAADLTSYLRGLPWAQRAAQLIRYTLFRRRPPYFFFRPRRAAVRRTPPDWLLARREPGSSVEALASPIWSSYFEWAHPLFTRAPIELVYPWCDARVIEAAFALEPIPWLVDKHVVREMLRGRVSERIRRRRKSWVTGDAWRAEPPEDDLDIVAASQYIEPHRFREACRAAGFVSDQTLRALAFESWLRKLPRAVKRLRRAAW